MCTQPTTGTEPAAEQKRRVSVGARRRDFIIQVPTHCGGEIFIWNHSKNNNVSPSHADNPLSLPCPTALRVLPPARQRQIKLNVTQLFSVCAARWFPQIWWLLSLGASLRSLAVAARVYHRAYKSVHEDQIGFQKYKILGDIKKTKGRDEAARKDCAAGTKEKETRNEGRNQEKRETEKDKERKRKKEGDCRRTREAHDDWWVDSERRRTCLHKFRINLYALRFRNQKRSEWLI